MSDINSVKILGNKEIYKNSVKVIHNAALKS